MPPELKKKITEPMTHMSGSEDQWTENNSSSTLKVKATSSAPKLYADKPGTFQTTGVLTGQCFGALA